MTARDLFGNTAPAKPPKRTPAAKRPPGQFGRPRRLTRADHIMARNMTPKRLAAQTRRSLNGARAAFGAGVGTAMGGGVCGAAGHY